MTTSKISKKYFICNFKSLLLKEDFLLIKDQISSLEKSDKIELILCPPTTYLYIFENTDYKLGSQEISMYSNGAYTGENSAEQLKPMNVSYALIGHHESRNILNETENTLIDKIVNAYNNHIKPIYFIGEDKNDKLNNQTQKVLNQQLNLLHKLSKEILNELIIVYEPVWSIGSGEIPNMDELNNNVKFISSIIENNYQTTIPILYGGSINEQNIEYLSQNENISGVIIGESSTNIDILKEIYQKYQKFI